MIKRIVIAAIASLAALSPVVAPFAGILPPAWFTAISQAIAIAGALHLGGPLAGFLARRRLARELSRELLAKATIITGAALLGLVAAAVISGCSWFAANKGTISSDAAALAACEVQYLVGDVAPTPEGAVAACAGLALADAVQLFATLEATASPDGGPSPVAVKIKLARVRR